LEIRSQYFGFVVLEGVAQLLDWGMKRYPSAFDLGSTAFGMKIASLLDRYRPEVVVARKRRRGVTPDREARLWETIRSEASHRAIKVRVVSAAAVQSFFAAYGCNSKEQVASVLADWFEELAWRLPARRKVWQHERRSGPVFDAIATAMTFLGSGR
jgi:hypothetical protein